MTCASPRFGDSERGAGTAMMAGLVAVVMLIIVGIAILGSATVGRTQAQSAADLAALSAAQVLAESRVGLGAADACATARAVAMANGASIRRCTEDTTAGTVAVVVARNIAGVGQAMAHARAGPAPAGVPTGSS